MQLAHNSLIKFVEVCWVQMILVGDIGLKPSPIAPLITLYNFSQSANRHFLNSILSLLLYQVDWVVELNHQVNLPDVHSILVFVHEDQREAYAFQYDLDKSKS